MSDLVTDLPIWEDCPFRDKIHPSIEIRRGVDDYGRDQIVFWDPETLRHIDWEVKALLAEPCLEFFQHINRHLGHLKQKPLPSS